MYATKTAVIYKQGCHTKRQKKTQLFWLIKVIFYILLGPAQKPLPKNKLTNIYLKDKDLIFKLI